MSFPYQFKFPYLSKKIQINFADSLLVSKPVSEGIISFLKGDFENDNFMSFVKFFCEK